MVHKASRRTVQDLVHIHCACALQPEQHLKVFGDGTAVELLAWKWGVKDVQRSMITRQSWASITKRTGMPTARGLQKPTPGSSARKAEDKSTGLKPVPEERGVGERRSILS